MTEQRVAVVTGSARGIGRAIADELAKAGHRVVGVDILAHSGDTFADTHTVDLGDAAAQIVRPYPQAGVQLPQPEEAERALAAPQRRAVTAG